MLKAGRQTIRKKKAPRKEGRDTGYHCFHCWRRGTGQQGTKAAAGTKEYPQRLIVLTVPGPHFRSGEDIAHGIERNLWGSPLLTYKRLRRESHTLKRKNERELLRKISFWAGRRTSTEEKSQK